MTKFRSYHTENKNTPSLRRQIR